MIVMMEDIPWDLNEKFFEGQKSGGCNARSDQQFVASAINHPLDGRHEGVEGSVYNLTNYCRAKVDMPA